MDSGDVVGLALCKALSDHMPDNYIAVYQRLFKTWNLDPAMDYFLGCWLHLYIFRHICWRIDRDRECKLNSCNLLRSNFGLFLTGHSDEDIFVSWWFMETWTDQISCSTTPRWEHCHSLFALYLRIPPSGLLLIYMSDIFFSFLFLSLFFPFTLFF